jgi:hypothetical protein
MTDPQTPPPHSIGTVELSGVANGMAKAAQAGLQPVPAPDPLAANRAITIMTMELGCLFQALNQAGAAPDLQIDGPTEPPRLALKAYGFDLNIIPQPLPQDFTPGATAATPAIVLHGPAAVQFFTELVQGKH